jgi:hypothetical protein
MKHWKKACLKLGSIAAIGAALIGCGSDDDDGGGGSNSAALASCNQVCDKQAGTACALLSAQECKEFCSAIMQNVNADCAAKQKAAADCQLAQPDVCETAACQAEEDAAFACLQT